MSHVALGRESVSCVVCARTRIILNLARVARCLRGARGALREGGQALSAYACLGEREVRTLCFLVIIIISNS